MRIERHVASARAKSERAGRTAETLTAIYLRLKGYRILARRYVTPLGEIDLVARKGRTVVFVEVKRRRSVIDALVALTPRQQLRIGRAARMWTRNYPSYALSEFRFDVVAMGAWRWPAHRRDVWRE